MAKSSPLIERYARMGAEARLAELRAEIAEIERTFPGIGGRSSGGRRPGRPRASANIEASQADASGQTPARKRKGMSAAQKKAVGERMRKYWAERRKAEGAKKR